MRQAQCPYCGHLCEAEWVDIGAGFEQVTPFDCGHCSASQINPYHYPPKEWIGDEKKTGWYPPPMGEVLSPSPEGRDEK